MIKNNNKTTQTCAKLCENDKRIFEPMLTEKIECIEIAY